MTSHPNTPPPTRRKVQSTLSGALGRVGQPQMRKEIQPETRQVRKDKLRIYFQNVNGIKSGTKEWDV
jgi:hypothetical protein